MTTRNLCLLLAFAGGAAMFAAESPSAPPTAAVPPPAKTAPPSSTQPAAAPAPTGVHALASSLEPKPAPNAIALPTSADSLVRGYGTQAQQGLILAYFASGTLGDGLTAGSVSATDGRRQAESYLNLAKNARDDLRHVRETYVFEGGDLALLDQLGAGYADVIPMIEAARKLADAPKDPAARAACEATKRRAYLTLSSIFGWK